MRLFLRAFRFATSSIATCTYLYYWMKVVVGALLVANYSLPLHTVMSNRGLWDEPMAVLAGNLSGAGFMMGIMAMLNGVYDLTQMNNSLCVLLVYGSGTLWIASKVAHVCLAVDQFVAVTRPLHYYQTMERFQPWRVAFIWLTWAANSIASIQART